MGSQQKIVDLPVGKQEKWGGSGGKPPPSSSPRQPPRARTTAAVEKDLKERLTTVFTRIADAADARGDMELAEVVRDDTEIMATGLVSLTRPFMLLRTPLLLLLAVVEPVMAFGRIGRLTLERVLIRRERRKDEARESTDPH